MSAFTDAVAALEQAEIDLKAVTDELAPLLATVTGQAAEIQTLRDQTATSATTATNQKNYAQEWASAVGFVSVDAGGDGATTKSAKTLRDETAADRTAVETDKQYVADNLGNAIFLNSIDEVAGTATLSLGDAVTYELTTNAEGYGVLRITFDDGA